MKKLKLLKKKKIIITFIVAIALVGGISGYYYLKNKRSSTPDNQGQTAITDNSPTAQDIKDTQDFKNKLIQSSTSSPTQSSTPSTDTRKVVTPVILSIGQIGQKIEGSAFVPGIVEDGGHCNYIFTQGTTEVSKLVNAFANATTTNCIPLSFDKSELSTGTWSVTLWYASGTSYARGQSSSSPLVVN